MWQGQGPEQGPRPTYGSDAGPAALELVLKLKEQDELVPFSPEDILDRTRELMVENTNVEETTHDL